MTKRVLAIGIDPAFLDFSSFPQFTPEMFRQHIDSQIDRVRALGYDVTLCLVDLGDTAEAVTATALGAGTFDCVLIGAGLREGREHVVLLEKIVNLVHRLANGRDLLQHDAIRHGRGRAALDQAIGPPAPQGCAQPIRSPPRHASLLQINEGQRSYVSLV